MSTKPALELVNHHHTRRGERDPERWQTASQLVTHVLLRDAGFTLPPDAEAWEDLSVDFLAWRFPAVPRELLESLLRWS